MRERRSTPIGKPYLKTLLCNCYLFQLREIVFCSLRLFATRTDTSKYKYRRQRRRPHSVFDCTPESPSSWSKRFPSQPEDSAVDLFFFFFQNGGWDNFRNGTLDGKPFVYPAGEGWVPPPQGLLCIDYVSPLQGVRERMAALASAGGHVDTKVPAPKASTCTCQVSDGALAAVCRW